MFEKTLTDVVKGIRASRRDTSLYISQCIAEIKAEINSSDMFVKANALQKLTFLQMMGYGMSWASFASIELMSSSRFAHKRIAYLAASQGFTQDTDVILLTTNLLKKELRGGVYEAGLAVNCISNIVTEDLARDLLPELTSLTSHPQPYLRKKAILCLFKVFVKYPQGLRLTFAKIQQSLDDPNPSVVSCAVNVITELSDKNPKNYLHLAPSFFQLLTTSSNNWMLIKVVKLLGSLVPEEPRLARKLLEPLADIVRNTKAKSLLYEAAHTITLCLPYCRRSDGSMPANVPDIVTLCAETLQGFVKEADQNLKYLGLVGFAGLMQSHPRILSAPGYRPMILACLSDQDITIRSRALSLLPGMASRKNLIELVTQLLKHVELATGSYKLDLVAKIVEICSSEKYALLQDFGWYLDVLFQLGHTRGLDAHSVLLRSQISDVALRVLPVRPFAVRRSIEILLERDGVCSVDLQGDNGRGRRIMPEILPAVAWIVGEYSDLIRKSLRLSEDDTGDEFMLDDKSRGTYHSLIQALTSTSNYQKLDSTTQEVYLQAAMKVFAAATADAKIPNTELEGCSETLRHNLPLYVQSVFMEVQERAVTAQALLFSMGLFDDSSPIPSLEAVDSDSENDGIDGDLLGMGPGPTGTSNPSKSTPKMGSSSSKLSSKLREASPILNYVLKPSPMKPTSAKSQRKKSQAPVGVDASDMSIDTTVFSVLFKDQLSTSYSMESVSFTQQTLSRPYESRPASNIGAATELMQEMSVSSGAVGGGGMSSFQSGPTAVMDSGSGLARQNQNDPFYLDSSPKTKTSDDRDASHFGMIQLSDSDEGAAETPNKKKKKKKKEKRQKHSSTFSSEIPTAGSGFAVYDSDDDGGITLNTFNGPSRSAPAKRTGKEFEGLAKVDLTEPLREDEVMPERRHRVVPDRPSGTEAPTTEQKPRKKSKKSKKESKKADKKSKKDKTNAGGQIYETADLLELGDFGSPPPSTNVTAPAPGQSSNLLSLSSQPIQSSTSAINDSFDDLLGLGSPTTTPAPPMTNQGQLPTPFTTNSNIGGFAEETQRPWIRATVKSQTANTELERTPVQFKVFPTSSVQGPAAMVAIRVVNAGGSVLSGVSISFKGQQSLTLGDIMPAASKESEKIGPFMSNVADAGVDIKGMLSASGTSVSIKLAIPVSLHLRPRENLSFDSVTNELSSPGLDSRSVKLNLSPATPPASVKAILSNYLGASEVDMGIAGDSASTATLAAQSTRGEKLLFLLKVKASSVKVDLKSSNPGLGKALGSDLKKLAL